MIQRGSIVAQVRPGDIDLRRKITMPGFVLQWSGNSDPREIEHGTEANRGAIHAMVEHGCIYVPKLAVVEDVAIGVRLAAGGDTGAFNHGQGARGLKLLIEAGIPVEDVLKVCMLGGWESCGRDAGGYRFDWLEKGNCADIIALDDDLRIDEKAFRKVSFVMKDAHVWKQISIPVGFIDRIMDKTAHSDSVWKPM